MKILITGGGGFIGSNAAEYFAGKGHDVVCYDNLSRAALLRKTVNLNHNWSYLKKLKKVKLVVGDVRDFNKLKSAAKGVDVIIHTAGQTAVTTSIIDPRTDFEVNMIGAFNVLEVARLSKKKPIIIDCSTNKVYGSRVNEVGLLEGKNRYRFERKFKNGISESFLNDHCEHTPYGCSKFAADIYMQDYARIYGLKVGIFRMSCIYGERQFGVEDQGWVMWFVIATLLGKPLTIFGDGKQVRDILYIGDLIRAYELFIESKIDFGVFNMGGGSKNTISLIELISLLKGITSKKSLISFQSWRPSDQKVYISDISKAMEQLDWVPKIDPKEGVGRLVKWAGKNLHLFKENSS
ncbi:MAG: GDP-mannose 4,6-dehydratase [bacterium]|nr:GDP-mannose 4,6-dehydratase [bacterium]